MASKRMFNLSVVNTDKFLDLPPRAQVLYFHMAMRADDDGILENPRMVTRACGASQTDFDALVESGYLILFDSGVVCIVHWHLHNNQLPKDRYKTSLFVNEVRQLVIIDDVYHLRAELTNESTSDNNQESECKRFKTNPETGCIEPVTNLDTGCIQNVYRPKTGRKQDGAKPSTQNRIDKNSIDKGSIVQHSTGQIRSDQCSTVEGKQDTRAPTREVIHNAVDNSAEEELRAKLQPEAMARVMAFCRDTQKARGGQG